MSSTPETLEMGDKLQWLAEHGRIEVSHNVISNPAPGDLRHISWTVKFATLDSKVFNYISGEVLGECVSSMMEIIQKRLRQL